MNIRDAIFKTFLRFGGSFWIIFRADHDISSTVSMFSGIWFFPRGILDMQQISIAAMYQSFDTSQESVSKLCYMSGLTFDTQPGLKISW